MTGVFMAAFAAFQEPEAGRLADLVRASGERRYVLTQNGQRVGTRVMRASIEKDGDREIVVFADDFFGPDGAAVMMSTRERALLKGLRLLSSKRTMQGAECTVRIEGGKALVDLQGTKRAIEITEATVGESAVHVLLSAAPQKEGGIVKVDFFEPLMEHLMKGLEIRCAAKEEVEVAGRKEACFRWELKWEKHEQGDGWSSTTRREDTYWIDAGGRILRARLGDGVDMVIEEKK